MNTLEYHNIIQYMNTGECGKDYLERCTVEQIMKKTAFSVLQYQSRATKHKLSTCTMKGAILQAILKSDDKMHF